MAVSPTVGLAVALTVSVVPILQNKPFIEKHPHLFLKPGLNVLVKPAGKKRMRKKNVQAPGVLFKVQMEGVVPLPQFVLSVGLPQMVA